MKIDKDTLIFFMPFGLTLFLIIKLYKMTTLLSPTLSNEIRDDDAGGGHYHDSRGSRLHNGIDLVTVAMSPVYAPISGKITRIMNVYSDSDEMTGVEILGKLGTTQTFVKLFYCDIYANLIGKQVSRGQEIGIAQPIAQYHAEKGTKGMLDHIHLEVWQNSKTVNPIKLLSKIPKIL